MNEKVELFLNELNEAIENDSLALPSLPEVVLKISNAVDNENATAEQVANAISLDGTLSARLIQVVNSPLYRTVHPIENLQFAVATLGVRLVRDLVMNLAMRQMFQTTSKILNNKFRNLWNTSVDVAAICQMMSVTMADIAKEQALLAGLIHNIGALPIIRLAKNDEELFNDSEALDEIIKELQAPVGAMILKNWDFSDSLVEVVTRCHDFGYTDSTDAGLVDLVQVALLQGGYATKDCVPEDWSLIPAFSKVGVDNNVNIIHLEGNKECIADAKATLML